jgi:HAE1 family hydrophobic/amphiphilic exporter-1
MKLRISAWAIRNPLPVALLFIALTIVGLLAYANLPIKQFPNVSFPIVSVTVGQNGAAPSEMENQITRPIENAVASVSGVRHISSTVTLGFSSTTIEFELGQDMQKATDDVRTAVERVRVDLPNGIDPPSVQRLDIDSAPILTYAVSAPKMSTQELSWFVEDTVARTLQAARGVAQVARVGGVNREINVVMDPGRMAALGITAPQINDALRLYNTDQPGGRANIGGREQTVRILGSGVDVEAIRNLTIPSNGRFVKLSEVAEVGDGSAEVRSFAVLDGRPAVAFQVMKTKEVSEVTAEDAVKKAIEGLEKANPDVRFTQILSTVDETRESYESTKHVLLEGMALASLVVFLFLKNWRATAIAAIAMPLSLIPTFAALAMMDFSLNIITLLALTLVIGILIDDAIVEIENIEKRIERGQSPYRASLLGADSIGLAVVATTATIVVVFTPVSFMGGIVGQFFKEFGLTVAVSVLFSLVVARLLTPLLAAYFLKPAKHQKPPAELPGFYRKSLDWALSNKWKAAGVGGLIFVLSIFLMSRLPTGFQPPGDPGFLYLNVEGPPGASREDMERVVARTNAVLHAQPDVERVFAQIGGSSGGGFDAVSGGELRSGTITVILKKDREHDTEEFKALIRPELRKIPDARINALNNFGSSGMEIVLSSEDGPALERAQAELLKQMSATPGFSDVRPSPPPPSAELVVKPKPVEAARLNVNSQTLSQILRVGTIGDIDANVAKYSEGKRRIPIRVLLPESARTDLNTLGQMPVPTLDGKTTPLASVADLSFQAGPARIVRYDRERRASVQAELEGLSLGQGLKMVNDLPIMKNLPPDVKQPPVGDAEALGDLISGFLIAMLSGIFLIFAVLVLLFGSFFKPATILSALPLSTVGAFLFLLLAGKQLDMPSLIGMLMLLGLAAKNSILLVEFAIEDERAGKSQREALMNACRERARPIVMTTVAMMAGMLPTALGLGQGASFRQPMAIAVIGGLISSTALSLVLVPVVYEFVDALEMWLKPKLGRFVTKKQPGDDDPIAEGEERADFDKSRARPAE